MLDDIIALASISSHSLDVAGLQRTAVHLENLFSPLTDHVETIPLPPFKHLNDEGDWEFCPLGHLLKFTKERPNAPFKLLFVGHYDTVYKHLFPIRQEGDFLFGPGVADMKGGVIMIYTILQWLESNPLKCQQRFKNDPPQRFKSDPPMNILLVSYHLLCKQY